ncbi:unnamed protein product [Lampetra planeri]
MDRSPDRSFFRFVTVSVLQAMLGGDVTEEQLQSIARTSHTGSRPGQRRRHLLRRSLEKVNIDHKMSIRFLK